MAIPQSTLFSVCDWNSRSSVTLDAGDSSITDLANGIALAALVENAASLEDTLWFGALATNNVGALVVHSQARLPGLSIPSSFSFEFDIHLTNDLPVDFSNVDNRVFVAAVNQQGATAGLLFSRQGIAVATSPDEAKPTILGGSASLLVDAAGALHPSLTVRLSVDSVAGTMTVLSSPTADAYSPTTGGALWAEQPDLTPTHTVPMRLTTLSFGDGVIVWGSACSAGKVAALVPGYTGPGQAVMFGVSSLRVSSGVVPLSARPVAVVSAASQIMVGRDMVFRGDESYDLAANPLTFTWEIESAPIGSAATLEGAIMAELEILTDLVIRYRTPTSAAMSFAVEILEQTHVTDELSISIADGTLTIRLGMKYDNLGALVPRSTGVDVVTAFYSSFSPAYCPSVAAVFAASVGTGGGQTALTAGVYLFSGATVVGTGSPLANPGFTPDVPGQYRVALVVSNGSRPSLKTTHFLLAAVTEQLVGHRPNADYIFRHISDFWNLVPDRAQLSSMWSAAMQAVSAEMLSAMQHDHAKSLRDISRRHQRRWLGYSTDVAYSALPAFTRPAHTRVLGLTVPDVVKGYGSAFATVSTPMATAPVAVGDRVLLRNSTGAPTVVRVTKVANVVGTTNQWVVHASPGSFTRYRLEGAGRGRFVRDPETPAVQTSVLFRSDSLPVGAFNKDLDLFRVTLGYSPTGAVVQVVTVNPARGVPGDLVNKTPMVNTLELLESLPVPQYQSLPAQPVDGRQFAWEHLRVSQGSHIAIYPYFLYPPAIDLTSMSIRVGDLAAVEVTDPRTGVVMPVLLPVVAAGEQAVFVQWSPLVELLTVLAPLGPDGDGAKVWTDPATFYGALTDWALRMTGIRRSRQLPGYTDLVSVPYLGSTVQAFMFENTDHTVVGGDVMVTDWLSGTVTTVAGSEDVVMHDAVSHTDFPVSGTHDDLLDVGAVVMVISEGDGGVYRVVGRPAPNVFTLDRKVSIGGSFPAYMPRHHHLLPLPATLWGEVSFFDNYAAIEGRYGLYVGVPKSLLDEYAPAADYLTTVRTLWFAFLNGPTLDNLRLPIQALLNLPCSEADGQITRIVVPTVETDGLITLVSKTGVTYTYSYPYGVDIGINPRTGRQFRAAPIDLVGTTDEQRELLDDAWVLQFTRLVEVVEVADYLSNPTLVDRELRGEQAPRRYHTFVVDVPLRAARSTQMFPLVRQILDKAKPAHTNYILVGSIDVWDDIEVEDALTLSPTIHLTAGVATSPWTAPKTVGAGPQGQDAISLADSNLLWPQEGVDTVFSAFFYPTVQLDTTVGQIGEVKERYESGYVEGAADNYSGDGSFNAHLSQVDQVNRLDVSSIDVCRSYLWVRVNILVNGFVVGEKVRLTAADATTELSTIWSLSPPVVEFVGAGHDPFLPDVDEPQAAHPYTYILIGFQYLPSSPARPVLTVPEFLETSGDAWDAVTDYGHEARLDALASPEVTAEGGITNVRLVGMTSAAVATPLDAIDHTAAPGMYDQYCLLDTVARTDKILDYGPESRLSITVHTYVPIGGMPLVNFKPIMLVAQDAQLERALQSKPWRPTALPADEQFVPSAGPGLFIPTDLSNFDGSPDIGPPAVATDLNMNVRWGYQDLGVLELAEGGAPQALTSFQYPTYTYLRNVHIGVTARSERWWHLTHGFTQFQVPTPKIAQVVDIAAGTAIQIEGHNFVEVDTTDTGGAIHDQLDGTYGGSWVFLRVVGDLTLLPATSVVFATGPSVSTVLWHLAGTLDMDGLVLQAIPAATLEPANTQFDVVVRQYRRYPGDAGPGPYIDTVVAEAAVTWDGAVWVASYGVNPIEVKAGPPAAPAEFYW